LNYDTQEYAYDNAENILEKACDYRASYYDPSVGRFLSEDPIQSAESAYVYVGNDPVNYVDPEGLSRAKVCLNTMKLILTNDDGKPIFCPRCESWWLRQNADSERQVHAGRVAER
jgi:RHS repeat-associated protein